MLVWMAYATLIGALLTGAAWIAEAALRGRGHSARWSWIAAMVLTFLLPLAAFLPARPESEGVAVGMTAAGPEQAFPVVDIQAPLRAASASRLASPDYGRILGIGWAMMSAAMLVCLALGAGVLMRRRRGWRSERVDGVDVLVAPDAGPAAVGMLRPRIVLPSWALAGDPEHLRLMLRHEMEHVRARDPLLLGAASLLLALMPWNPALWWQAARLRDGIELDCDGRVLRLHPDPRRYADVLLHVARGESRWLLASPGMARHRSLERRIRRLAGTRRWSRASIALATTAVVALAVIACGVERPSVESDRPAPGVVAAAGSSDRDSSPRTQRAARLQEAATRHDRAVRTAIERHYPELITRGVAGDQAFVWLLANSRGELERTAIDSAAPPRDPVLVVTSKWPDLHPRDLGSAGMQVLPAGAMGPDAITVMWWQRTGTAQGSGGDIFHFGFDRASTHPTTERMREIIARHHPALIQRPPDDIGVWVIATWGDEVLLTGSGEPFRSSRDVERELGGPNGYEFRSVTMTSIEGDDGEHLDVVWAIVDED